MTDENENLPARVGRTTQLTKRMISAVRMLSYKGCTDKEMAEGLDIPISTFYKWLHDFPEFSEAIHEGKKRADLLVEDALYRRAQGMTLRKIVRKTDKLGNVEIIETIEDIPPETQAGKYWLNNRASTRWKSKVDCVHTQQELLPTEIVISKPKKQTKQP